MSNRNPNSVPRHPPDKKVITLAIGAQLRVSRAGLEILGAVVVAVVFAALLWMNPEQAASLLVTVLDR